MAESKDTISNAGEKGSAANAASGSAAICLFLFPNFPFPFHLPPGMGARTRRQSAFGPGGETSAERSAACTWSVSSVLSMQNAGDVADMKPTTTIRSSSWHSSSRGETPRTHLRFDVFISTRIHKNLHRARSALTRNAA
ncbi:predicted protein [Verticillium alfalfae VaMs.102]|uniref:Predicted protein n=1 Tax=Verticillium alfalfae (strain VaMs.102 / ATCC MYA-4576 / FGSC 10136) TaxID=526221 RepID=C9SPT4_VERA1|nr:predicted protein [Verticillium alfalfae VaMs.102]EEY20799.1 predicted protein [Verticillium alfalfae VaMs.102]